MKKVLILSSVVFISTIGFFLIKNYGPFATSNRPNIVLIIIDTLRADKLGCYGFPENTSPEIDRIANKGILFEHVISQSSWTRPSIGSMLTSLYPRTIGIYKEEFDILHDRYETFAEILHDNGYYTMGITANPNINRVFNFHQGFDDYADSTVIWPWMMAKKENNNKIRRLNFLTSDDIFKTVLKKANRSKQTPWYIQINIMEVHSPHIMRNQFKESFTNQPNSKYCSAIKQVSFDIDIFIEKLCSIPGWKNTLFVITSDHGEGLDDHPDVAYSESHGYTLYESQTRVPLILFHSNPPPIWPVQKRINERIRLLDLVPTLLDYVGISHSGNLDGRSVVNLIQDKKGDSDLPHFFIAETNWKNVNKIAVYSDKWKYIENHDNWPGVNRIELQPMGIKENGINTDRIDNTAEVAKEMKKHLDLWQVRHKKTECTSPGIKVSEKEIEQLKSIGYLK